MFIVTDKNGKIIETGENAIASAENVVIEAERVPDKSYFALKSDNEKTQLLVNIAVASIAGGIIFLLLFIRGIFAPPVFILLYLFFIGYMAIDFMMWRNKGIRIIFLTEEGLLLICGKNEREEFIPYSAVTDINLHKKGPRKIVNILLGGKAGRFAPGVTLFSGKRKRITNDAFDDVKFDNFISLLSSEHLKRKNEADS